jgi:O-antigen ligase
MKALSVKIYDYLFAALLLLMPFGSALPNIVIALLVLFFAVDYKSADYKRLRSLPVMALYAFLAYYFIRGAITGALFIDWNIYKKYIILFLLPVLFLKVKRAEVIKAGVVVSAMICVAAGFFLAARFYVAYGYLPFTSGDTVNSLLLMERPYAGFFTVAAAIFSFELAGYYTKHRKLFITCGIAAILFIITISARISFLTLIFVAGLYIVFYMRIAVAKKAMFVGVCLAGVALVFTFNKNLASRFFIKENLEQSIQATDYEPRLVIWPCAYNMALRDDFNVLFGFPDHKTIVNNYVECFSETIDYNESKKEYFVTSKFNSHNQFLDFYLSSGLIGLLLFSAFIFILLYKVKSSFYDTALLLSLVLFLFVENVLHRQTGCYIFSIFGALLMMRNKLDNEKN